MATILILWGVMGGGGLAIVALGLIIMASNEQADHSRAIEILNQHRYDALAELIDQQDESKP